MNAEPSKDPANDGGMPGTLTTVLTKHQQRIHSQLPARVINYDRARNVATVQPLVMVLATDGTTTERAAVAEVPVLALGGGGYVLNFPLKSGDLGWIEASDRDISLFMQSLAVAAPNTVRLHSFEDGRFVPDAFRSYVVAGEDAERVVLQTLDGSTRIALGPGVIKMVTGGVVEIEAPLTQVTGNVTVSGDVIASGISLVGHVHGQVQPGAGTSGVPQ